MEIKEFSEKKMQMEKDIALAVGAFMAKFKHETGYSPDNIRVRLVDVTAVGQENQEYIVADVEATVKL